MLRRKRTLPQFLSHNSRHRGPNRSTSVFFTAPRSFETLEPRQMLTVGLLGAPDWTELGPAPSFFGGSLGIGSGATTFDDRNPVAGAVLQLAPHPTNADILIAATVNGGIWKTTNAKAEIPTWTARTDGLDNLSMGAIAISPSSPNVVAAGFGKTSSYHDEGGLNGGFLLSTDTGDAWRRVGGSAFAQQSITSIAFGETDSNLILASARSFEDPGVGGVFRSTDQGATWTKVLGAANARATDLKADYENNVFFAVIPNDGVYRSDATGQNWVKKDTGIDLTAATNVKIAVHDDPTDTSDAVYVGVINSGFLHHVYRSEDAGDTWTQLADPSTDEGRFDGVDNDGDTQIDEAGETNAVGLFATGQGDKHFSLVADRSDPNVVYVGGDTQPSFSAHGANAGGCDKFVGRVFKGTASGASTNWTQIVCSGADRLPAAAGGETAPHADSRSMIFDADGNLLETDDGGIYKLTGSTNKFWIARHGNMGVTEVTNVAYDPLFDRAVIGAQDNGSSFERIDQGTQWNTPFTGDGYFQDIASGVTATSSRWFSMANNMNFFVRRDMREDVAGFLWEEIPGSAQHVSLSFAGDTTPASNFQGGLGINDSCFLGITVLCNAPRNTSRVLKTPFVVNPFDSTRMMLGYFEVYESFDQGETLTEVLTPSGAEFGATAIVYGHPSNVDLAYVARPSKLFMRTTAAGAFTQIDLSAVNAERIVDIAVDPDDQRHVFLATQHGILEIKNAGQTDAALPIDQQQSIRNITTQFPGRPFLAVAIVKFGAGKALLAGGPGGLLRSLDFDEDEVTWSKFGRNLPSTVVVDIDYDATDDILLAGELGRGVFAIRNVGSQLIEPDRLQIDGTSGPDTIRLRRSPGNPSNLEVFVNSPTTPTLTIPISQVFQVVVDGKEAADNLIIDTTGGVIPFTSFTYIGGVGADTLTLQGPTTATTVQAPAFAEMTDDNGRLTVETFAVDTITNNTFRPAGVDQNKEGLKLLNDGSALASSLFQAIGQSDALGSIPLVGDSLLGGLERGIVPGAFTSSDPVSNIGNLAASLRPEILSAGKSLFKRLFEDGLNGFSLSEIGSTSIASFTALRDKIEMLDGIANNGTVNMTLSGGLPTYAVHLTKNLQGTSEFDLQTNGGNLAFSGNVEIGADVNLNLTFGVDSQGFFIDTDSSATPEISINNLTMSHVTAAGRIGFLTATLTNGTLTSDAGARVAINIEELADPITGVQDNKLRLWDLRGVGAQSFRFTASVQGDPDAQADLTLGGKFTVTAFNTNIANADLSFSWADISQPTQVTVSATANTPGAKLFSLLSANAQQIVDALVGPGGLTSKLEGLADAAANTVLSRPIPVLGKSLGDLLLGAPKEIHFGAAPVGQTSTAIARVSSVSASADGSVKKFSVTVANDNPSQQGVAAGDVVTYLGAGGQTFTGTVDAVEQGIFTVAFDGALSQNPNTSSPAISVQTGGSFTKQIKAALGRIVTGGKFSDNLPTLDQLLFELGRLTGIDAFANVNVDLNAGVITFPLKFNPDPLKFSHNFDLGEDTPGLAFNSAAALSIDPNFEITIGLKLGDVPSLADRFFIVENATPEISLHFDASLDGALSAQLGFLGLTATKTAGVPGGNNGITFVGDVSLNLQEPGADAGLGAGDNRITLNDIVTAAGGNAGNLASVFQPTLVADVDIDGIDVVGSAFGQTIASMHVQLAGDTPADPGHISATSFAQLQTEISQLLTGLQVTGTVNTDFSNISFESLIGMLNQVGAGLIELSGKLNPSTGIPLIRKQVSDVVQLGQAITNVTEQFIVRDPLTHEIVDYTVKSVQEFLAEAPALLGIPGAQITYNAATHRLEFGLSKDFNFSRATELDFEGALGSTIDVRASGSGSFSAAAHLAFGMGVDLTPLTGDQTLLDKFFLKTGAGNEVTVASAISATNIDLGASVGILGVGIENGTLAFNVGTGVQLVDPTGTPSDGRLYLAELFANPLGSVSLKPLTAAGSAHLPVQIEGVSFGAANPAIDVSLALGGGNPSITPTLNNDFQQIINQFQSFSLDDLATVINQVVGVLQGANFGAFHKKLPLVNKSVDELLTVVSDLSSAANNALQSIDVSKLDVAVESITAAIESLPVSIDTSRLDELVDDLAELAQNVQSQSLTIDALRSAFASVSHGLDGVIEQVTSSLTGDAGASIRDQFTIAIDALEDAVPSLQSLSKFLTKTVHLGGDSTVTIGIEDADATAAVAPAIVVRLHLGRSFDDSVPFDFSVAAGSSNVPFEFQTGGALDVFAGGAIDLNFGVNVKKLTAGQGLASFFLLDTSGIGLDVSAAVNDFLATVKIGGLQGGIGSTVPNPDDLGTIAITSQAGSGPAHIGLDVTGGDAFGAVYFGAGDFASHLNFTGINGKLNATLPLYLGNIDAGDLVVSMPSLSDPTNVTFTTPNGLLSSLIGGQFDLNTLLTGIDTFLQFLENAMEGETLHKLPILGDNLDTGAAFVNTLHTKFNDVIAAANINTLESSLENALFSLLGPSGVNVLAGSSGCVGGNPVAAEVNAAAFKTGLVTVTLSTAADGIAGLPKEALLNVRLCDQVSTTAKLDLNLGGMNFGVQSQGGIQVSLGYDAELGFGLSKTNGFYFQLDSNPADPELELNVAASLTSGASIDANLFFLDVTATEKPGGVSTGFNGSVTVNINDPGVGIDANSRLSVNEIRASSAAQLFTPSVNGTANVDLHLAAGINSANGIELPRIEADLSVTWSFLTNHGLTGDKPSVALNNLTLDIGQFLTRSIQPLLSRVDDTLDPIRPLLDFLQDPIPVISTLSEKVGLGEVTFLTLLGLATPQGKSIAKFINIADGVIDFIDDIASLGPNSSIVINFGSFTPPSTQDFRTNAPVNVAGGVIAPGAGGSIDNQINNSSANSLVDSLLAAPSETLGNEDAGLGIGFPLLQNPANLFKILFGQTVDLVTWDIPAFDVGLGPLTKRFGPILPPIPLFVTIGGSLRAFADLFVGFDTRGLAKTGRFFDGFYISDLDAQGNDAIEFGVSATVAAGAELNLLVASAGVEGGITATFGANWHDRDSDGKLYFDEIADRFARGTGHDIEDLGGLSGSQILTGLSCLFDFTGETRAFLQAYVDTALTGRKAFPDPALSIPLFSINTSLCPASAELELGEVRPDQTLVRPADLPSGAPTPQLDTLVAFVGPNAGLRKVAPLQDIGESITIHQTAFNNNNGKATITITGFGVTRTFTGVEAIYVDAGAGNDVITVDDEGPDAVTIPVLVLGSEGDDILVGGGLNGSLFGGDGDDDIDPGPLRPDKFIDIRGDLGFDEILHSFDDDLSITDNILDDLNLGSGPFIPHTGFEGLRGSGGFGLHTLNVSGFRGHVDVLGGVDEVVDDTDDDFSLSDTLIGRGPGRGGVVLHNVGRATLGNPSGTATRSNTYTVKSWTGDATLHTSSGRLGADDLVIDNDVDVTLTNSEITLGGGGHVALAGSVRTAKVQGGASARRYDVGAFTRTLDLDGGGGGDAVAYSLANAAGPASINVSFDDIRNIVESNVGGEIVQHTFSNVDRIEYTGTPFDDTFSAGSSPVPVTFHGIGGNDVINGSFNIGDILDGGANDDTIFGASGGDLLDGGLGNDRLVGTPHPTLANTVRGGAGIDTYVEQDNIASWTLSSASLVKPGRATVAFDQTDVENLDLTATGGVAASFNTTNWTGGGSLAGGEGSSIIDTSDANFTISNTSFSKGGGIFALPAILAFTIGSASSTANNTLTLSDFTGSLSFIGGAGLDRVVVSRDANFTLTNTLLQISSGGFFQFPNADVEEAQLTGGPGANSFAVTDWTGAAILDGAGAVDLVPNYGASALTSAAINIASSSNLLTRSFGPAAAGSLQLANIEQLTLSGGAQNDALSALGLPFGVAINGNDGNDTLTGGSGPDSLSGGNGLDRLTGNAGNDQLTGGANDDTYVFGAAYGVDTIVEAAAGGNDTLDFSAATANLIFGISSAQVVVSEGANTATHTGAQVERLIAGAGDDAFNFTVSGAALAGGTGTITGGLGTDTLSYVPFNAASLVSVNLLTGAATGLANVSGIENVIGGLGNDTLTGDNNANQLEGRNGNDIIVGNGGNDRILDGVGADTVDGGSGDDTYVTAPTGGATDTISDVSGNDTLDLSTTATIVTLDLDSLGTNQNYTGTSNLRLNGLIENYNGSIGRDTISVDPLTVPRNLVGGNPTTAPGDTINYDGRGLPTIVGAGSFHSAGMQPVTFSQFETTSTSNVLNAPPQVTGVRVGLRSGQSNTYSIPVGTGAQLASLPWDSINVVEITFSESVEVEQQDLSFVATNRTDFAIDDFFYTPATRTATWALETNIREADKILLLIKAEDIRDLQGDILDGEWDNPSSRGDTSSNLFPSGDIFPGGDFTFRFNVVPGDANQDFEVNRADVAAIMNDQFREKSDPLFRMLADTNDDGIVNMRDAILIRNYFSTALPNGEPSPSPSAPSPAAAAPTAAILAAPSSVVQLAANRNRVDAVFAHGDPSLRMIRATSGTSYGAEASHPQLRARRAARNTPHQLPADAADKALSQW